MKEIAAAIENSFISPNESDSNFEAANVVDGLFAVARSINGLAKAVDRLGTNDVATNMGAIEILAKEVSGAGSAIAAAIGGHSQHD